MYVILLRGVTPSGKNKVPMQHLREVLRNAHFQDVQTYIQSGNALIKSELPARTIEKRVYNLIKDHIGPELTIIVRTPEELQQILVANPFRPPYDTSRIFFVLFAEPPSTEKIKNLTAQDFGDERLVITQHAAYLYIPGTYGRGKLSGNFLEKKLGVSATMRNFNTMSKLASR